MQDSKTIIYVGNFHFPNGNAAGKRVYGNSALLKELGYDVNVIDTNADYQPHKYELSTQTKLKDFNCFSLPYPQGFKGWLRFYDAFREVKKHIIFKKAQGGVCTVVMYGSPTLSLFNLFLIKFCKNNDIRILADCVDWLSINSKSILFNCIKSSDDFFQKAICNKMTDGVICISSFLSNYYQNAGLKTILIPPLNANNEDEIDKREAPLIPTFIYAGRPFRDDMKKNDVGSMKDRVDLIFKVFSDLKLEGYDFILHIYGFSSVEFLKCVPDAKSNIETIAEKTKFHGHASNADVLSTLKDCSFSILFRDSKRDTIAGFPTKVAESITAGIPVIVSDVGDAKNYITEGVNGFLSPANNYGLQLESVRKALDICPSKVNSMKENCLSDTSFSTHRYKSSFSEFLNSL
jgi:glycosyltransferase involved in cell wall biosynthesis